MSAAWMVAAAPGSDAIAYRFYARFIAYKVLKADRTRATPAEHLDNGIDFHPTDRRVLLGHHFAAIAGAGPLVGPVLAAQMGYPPGTIWIIVGVTFAGVTFAGVTFAGVTFAGVTFAGVTFAGAVQDMVVLFFSTRRDGRSLGQMAREEIGPFGGAAAPLAAFAIMIILLGVPALVVVNVLAVDGVLPAVLALLLIVVIADAARVCVRHVRRPALSTLSEAKYVESEIVAPAGLIPTKEEKEEAARDAVGAGQGG